MDTATWKNDPATEKQKQYLLDLFRKSNFHDSTLSNEALKEKILERDGVDVEGLTKGDMPYWIDRAKKKTAWRRRHWG